MQLVLKAGVVQDTNQPNVWRVGVDVVQPPDTITTRLTKVIYTDTEAEAVIGALCEGLRQVHQSILWSTCTEVIAFCGYNPVVQYINGEIELPGMEEYLEIYQQMRSLLGVPVVVRYSPELTEEALIGAFALYLAGTTAQAQ